MKSWVPYATLFVVAAIVVVLVLLYADALSASELVVGFGGGAIALGAAFLFVDWAVWKHTEDMGERRVTDPALVRDLERRSTASPPAALRRPAVEALRTISAANGSGGELSAANDAGADGALSDVQDLSGRVSLDEKKD